MDKFKIVNNGTGNDTKIFYGNKELNFVTNIEISIELGEPNKATITIYNLDLDIEIDKSNIEFIKKSLEDDKDEK